MATKLSSEQLFNLVADVARLEIKEGNSSTHKIRIVKGEVIVDSDMTAGQAAHIAMMMFFEISEAEAVEKVKNGK